MRLFDTTISKAAGLSKSSHSFGSGFYILLGHGDDTPGLGEVMACQEVRSDQVRAFLPSGPSISRARWYRTSAGCFLLLLYDNITFIRTSIGRSSVKSISSPHSFIKYLTREAMPPSVASSDDDEVSYRIVQHLHVVGANVSLAREPHCRHRSASASW